MKFAIKTLPLLLLTALLTPQLHAGAPTCYSSHSGYCSYKGKVKSLYVNSGNLILLYFDTPLAAGTSDLAGLTATQPATAVLLNENPEFAKLFYSTALTAQASGREVSIQMRGTYGGYLKADRIWLAE